MAASTESSGIYAELARVQEHGSSMAKGAAVISTLEHKAEGQRRRSLELKDPTRRVS